MTAQESRPTATKGGHPIKRSDVQDTGAPASTGSATPDRALPGWAIDLIRDGVTSADLKERGDRAVWSALLRIAHTAQIRGWGVVEWEAQILEDRNVLARQLRTKRDGRPKPARTVDKTLSKAWDAAWEHRTSRPTMDREQVAEAARQRAATARDVAADADNDLRESERDVLAHIAAETEERGLLRIACPWRTVADAVDLGERATKNALRDLVRRGCLVLVERGRPGGPSAKGRGKANLYGLPEAQPPHMCRGTRPVGPQTHTCGTSADPTHGAPTHTCGTPSQPSTHHDRETDMVQITVSAKDPEALTEAIRRLAGVKRAVEEGEQPDEQPLPDNVTRLDHTRRHA